MEERLSGGVVEPGTGVAMSSHGAGIHIEKLEGVSNYNSWKFQMKMLLTLEGLWNNVSGDGGDASRDQKALARICLSVKAACHQHVRHCSKAKEAWDTLAKTFEDKGLYRRVLLLRKLHHTDYNQFGSMTDYLVGIMTLVQQLADIGKVIEDAEVAELLLSGLPKEFDALVSNLETACLTNSLSSELVRSRLIQEEYRKNNFSEGVDAAFVTKNRANKSKIICHYCKKSGHIKSKCFKLKKDMQKPEEKSLVATAFVAESQDGWLIDSGCSAHMCNNKSLFTELTDCNNVISIANDEKLECLGKGTITVKTGKVVRNITNVLYVPKLSHNLLSVSCLTQKGFNVIFNGGGCFIYDKSSKNSGNPIFCAFKDNGLYRVNFGVCQSSRYSQLVHSSLLCNRQEARSAKVTANVPIDLWHKRLGHLGIQGMCTLKDGNATGVLFQTDNEQVLKECVPCLEGKMAAKQFPVGEARRATQSLELIHSDVCGPLPDSSLGGAKYLVTFTDDYTRKTFGYLMKHKSEVMSHFVNFKRLVEKQVGLPIKILRSDGGGEYCNDSFSKFLQQHGIIHQKSIPYCQSQNGVSERLNRTLMEKARCMLQGAGLCGRYWGEAVMTAIYLKNRSPTAALSGRTPEEVWTGSKPDLSHLHVFGCIAYSLVPEQKRRKLDPKSKRFLFVGYSETSKGYRLLDPSAPKNVVLSRNVVFIENKFHNNFNDIDNNDNDFIYFELTNTMDNLNSKNIDTPNSSNNDSNLLNSSENICYNNADMNSINDNVTSQNVSQLECDQSVSDDTIGEVTVFSDGEYCTGSEDDGVPAESPARDVRHGCVTPARDVRHACVTPVRDGPAEGGGGASPPVSESRRPVRSTRSRLPVKYNDYETDFSLIAQDFPLAEPQSFEEAVSCPDSDEWRAAMRSEYDSLISNNVWKLVDRPPNENVVKCKWVYKKKYDANGNFEKYKARLVARGFTQIRGVDYNDTFSPVVRHSTLRILFALANELNLNIDHIDVTTAFLNGELQETIFMEQPPGFGNDDCKSKVCLLLKGIYGLKQASRNWNAKVHHLLSNNSYKQSKCEPCVYIKRSERDITIIALYVDDFYIFYSTKCNELLPLLEDNFNIRNLGNLKNCLGMNIERDRANGIMKISQSEYIKRLLQRFGMENCKVVKTPMPTNCKLVKGKTSLCDDQYNYRQLMGCLMYLSVCTRPDISFACSQLSQFNNCFDVTHWQAAKRVLRYLAGTINFSLYFHKGGQLNLTAFADADWANDPNDRRSYTGFVVKLGNNVINWESRKQRCVALSSTEAEYLAITDVCKDICFIRSFLSEIIPKLYQVTIFNDNQSAQKLLLIKEYCHKRTKHIDIRYHFVKDLVQNGYVKVKYLQTESMVADVLTKPLCVMKHHKFVNDMNVRI